MAKSPSLTYLEPLELLEADRSNCLLYVLESKYIYYKNRVGIPSQVMYLQCQNRSCGSRLVCSTTTLIPTSVAPHKHPPQTIDINRLRFKAELRRRVRADPSRVLRDVYEEVAKEPRFKEAATRFMWSNLESMLLRVRKETRHRSTTKLSTNEFISNKLIENLEDPLNEPVEFLSVDTIKNETMELEDVESQNVHCDPSFTPDVENVIKNETMEPEDVESQNFHFDQSFTSDVELVIKNETLELEDVESQNVQFDSSFTPDVENVMNTALTSEELSEGIHRERHQVVTHIHQRADQEVTSPGEVINKTTSSRGDSETSNDFANLKDVINKLELISDKLAAASFADTYEQFGKYIGCLLRGLPPERVRKIMEKIVSDVLSIKLGFGVQVQPTDPVSKPSANIPTMIQAPTIAVPKSANGFSVQDLAKPYALSKGGLFHIPSVVLTSQAVTSQNCPAPSNNMAASLTIRPPNVVKLKKTSNKVKLKKTSNKVKRNNEKNQGKIPIAPKPPARDFKTSQDRTHTSTRTNHDTKPTKKIMPYKKEPTSSKMSHKLEPTTLTTSYIKDPTGIGNESSLTDNELTINDKTDLESIIKQEEENILDVIFSGDAESKEVDNSTSRGISALMPEESMPVSVRASGQSNHLFTCDRCTNHFHSSSDLKTHFTLAHPGFTPSFKTRTTEEKKIQGKRKQREVGVNDDTVTSPGTKPIHKE